MNEFTNFGRPSECRPDAGPAAATKMASRIRHVILFHPLSLMEGSGGNRLLGCWRADVGTTLSLHAPCVAVESASKALSERATHERMSRDGQVLKAKAPRGRVSRRRLPVDAASDDAAAHRWSESMGTDFPPDAARLNGTTAALTAKQEAFAVAVAKGSKASDAYRAVYSAGQMTPKSINEEACHLLANPKVASRVNELRAPAMKSARLEIEETLHQLACVLRSDARRLFRPDGSLIPVHELDDATAAAISSIELDDKGRPKKIRLWSKTDAIDKAMRHLGAFERDNRQLSQNLAIQVNLVGPEPKPGDIKRIP